MTSETPALVDAVRLAIREEITSVHQRMGDLVEQIAFEQHEQRLLLQSIEAGFAGIDARLQQLEEASTQLGARTSQAAGELVELKDRLRDGLRALKRETELGFRRIAEVQAEYHTQRNRLQELQDRALVLQHRLDMLEAQQKAQ